MGWEVYTAISVLFLSASVVLQRILLRSQKLDPYLYVVLFQTLVGVIIGAYAVVRGIPNPDLTNLWLISVLCVALYGVGHIFYAKTLQLVDASVFSVLFASHAVWMMLIGVAFFAEVLTWMQVVGSLLIFSSILVLVQRKSWHQSKSGIFYGLMTGLLFGLAITAWSYIGRQVEPISWAAWSFIGAAAVALLVRPKIVSKIGSFTRNDRDVFFKMVVLSVVYAIGSLAMLYAYIYGTLSVVSPLRQTGIIVTVLMALAILPAERVSMKTKLFAAITSFVGVVLIVMV